MRARVYLVGAGPGDPELLTVKAVRLLRSADIVLHDALVTEEILQIARPNAQLIDVGKRVGEKRLTQNAINQLLVDLSDCADIIVRLKGGDPLIFGRAAEEVSALRQAGIEFEIVPGITSALAAAAQAGIPLTDRRSAAGVVFLTAQQATGKGRTNIARYASQDSTLAIYMPTGLYREIRDDLIAAGLSLDTPCVVVANASRQNQELLWTDIAALGSIAILASPALIIIGSVARRPGEALTYNAMRAFALGDRAHYVVDPPAMEYIMPGPTKGDGGL
jgi:uroporphyrin-III C-methyltransferase